MNYKALGLALLALPIGLQAAEMEKEQAPQNTVRFSVEVEKEVPFDVLQVRLFVQEESTDLKALHKTISDKLKAALEKIKAQPAVDIKSNDRSTSVRYNEKGRKNGWIERADFVLESKDFYALSQVVDELSDVLSIENINSILSADAVAKLEDDLSKEALAKFDRKAKLIQNSLQAKGYRMLSLELPMVNEYHYAPQNRMLYAAQPMMAKSAVSDSVQIESGKTSVKARVNAKIELIEK